MQMSKYQLAPLSPLLPSCLNTSMGLPPHNRMNQSHGRDSGEKQSEEIRASYKRILYFLSDCFIVCLLAFFKKCFASVT